MTQKQMADRGDKRLLVYVPVDMHAKLKLYAAKNRYTMEDLTRLLISAGMRKKRMK